MYEIIDDRQKCVLCKKRLAYYNIENYEPIFCEKCVINENMNNNYKCKIKCKKCENEAYYSHIGEYPKNCGNCKEDDMIVTRKNIKIYNKNNTSNSLKCVECNKIIWFSKYKLKILNKNKLITCKNCKKCKSNFCDNERSINLKYKGYCIYCYINIFLDNITEENKNKLTKERQVVLEITKKISEIKWIYNKTLHVSLNGSGCCDSMRRIDIWALINNSVLGVEIDENQHKTYVKEDNEIRYNDLYMSYSGKYIIIRFNPNKYKKNGELIKKFNIQERYDILIKEINKQMTRIYNDDNIELMEIIHLFYDETK